MSEVNNRVIKRHREMIATVFSIFFAFFFAIMPAFGWSEYTLEGIMISCSVEWDEKTASVISFNITILIFVFLLPIFLIVITSFKLISYVSIYD
jgi:c-opsin